MAKMYKRQITKLTKWIDANHDKVFLYMAARDLPHSFYWELYNMHPHENFDSHVERAIADYMIENDIVGISEWY